MDITKMSDTELKALAYDQSALIERSQMNIRAINVELNNRNQPPLKEVELKEPKEKKK